MVAFRMHKILNLCTMRCTSCDMKRSCGLLTCRNKINKKLKHNLIWLFVFVNWPPLVITPPVLFFWFNTSLASILFLYFRILMALPPPFRRTAAVQYVSTVQHVFTIPKTIICSISYNSSFNSYVIVINSYKWIDSLDHH